MQSPGIQSLNMYKYEKSNASHIRSYTSLTCNKCTIALHDVCVLCVSALPLLPSKRICFLWHCYYSYYSCSRRLPLCQSGLIRETSILCSVRLIYMRYAHWICSGHSCTMMWCSDAHNAQAQDSVPSLHHWFSCNTIHSLSNPELH